MRILVKILNVKYGVLVSMAWLCIGFLSAQTVALSPLDEPTIAKPVSMLSDSNGNLLALQLKSTIGYKEGKLLLQKWNGLFWVTYPALDVNELSFSENNRMSMQWHKGYLYAAGSFYSNDLGTSGMVRWNGNKWEAVAGGLWSEYQIFNEIDIKEMASAGNSLFVCGNFNRAAGLPVNNFVVLNNNQFSAIKTNTGKVNTVLAMGDTCYAAGRFDSIESVAASNVAAFYGGNWHAAFTTSKEVLKLGTYLNQMVVVNKDSIALYGKSGLNTLFQGWKYSVVRIDDMAAHAGKLYCSGKFKNASGEISSLLEYDGQTWRAVIAEKQIIGGVHSYLPLCSAANTLFFGGDFSKIDNVTAKYLVQFKPGYSVIKGMCYMDNNDNCMFDPGDVPLKNRLLSLDHGKYYTSTDALGQYSLFVQSQSAHSLSFFTENQEAFICGSSEVAFQKAYSDSTWNQDFAVAHAPQIPDITANFTAAGGYKARHGYRNTYSMNVSSPSGIFPVDVRLIFPEKLVLMSSEHNYIRRGTHELQFLVYSDSIFKMEFLVNPLDISVGDSLRFYSTAHAGDISKYAELNQVVIAAFDPNDKQCDKAEIGGKDKTLEYHIRFQNLGNDSAVNIFVVDTISESLPLQYLKVTGNSHAQQYQLNYKIRDHALIWSFNDIYLPAKIASNDDASSGFVHFKAGVNSGLRVGDVIRNQAFIYFDYQKPVATNFAVTQVTSTIFSGNGTGELKLWPNPAQSELNLDIEPFLIESYEIYNLQGKLLQQSTLSAPSAKTKFAFIEMSSGVYIVKVKSLTGVVSTKFVVD